MRTHMMGGVVLAMGLWAGAAQAKPASTLVNVADLKWADVPGLAGVHAAPAEGDPSKGPSHFFVKFDKGFKSPPHHHSADHFVTVVSGTLMLTVDGKDVSLPAGSYFSFRGKQVHTTACDAAADCVLLIDARRKWDVVPEKAPK